MNSCNSAAGFHQLGRSSAPCSKNGLALVHDQNIVQRLFPCTGIAHILLIVDRILLPVHIIRGIAVLRQPPHTLLHHLFHRIMYLLLTLRKKIRRPFQRQSVHRDAVRIQCQNLFQRVMKSFRRIVRQAGDQIHVDVLEAGSPCHAECLHRLCRSVLSADCFQHVILHSLRVDRNAVYAETLQCFQLFRGNGVRSSCLDTIFPQMRKIKVFLHRRQHLFQLCRRQRSGRTTAKVDRIHQQFLFPYQLPPNFQFLAQLFQICRNQILSLCNGMGYKRTIAAPCRTKRNRHIQADAVLWCFFQKRLLHHCCIIDQRQLFRSNPVLFV